MIRLDVVNDGTGTPETGNYNVTLVLPHKIGNLDSLSHSPWREVKARVENFDRSRGAIELMRVALEAVESKLD